jgi:hypothetical protein
MLKLKDFEHYLSWDKICESNMNRIKQIQTLHGANPHIAPFEAND